MFFGPHVFRAPIEAFPERPKAFTASDQRTARIAFAFDDARLKICGDFRPHLRRVKFTLHFGMRPSRNIVLLFSAIVVTITSIGMNSFSLFLRPIEAEFGWSRTMVTVPYMFGMLGWAVGGVLFGKMADDLGARRVILGGILLMAAGFFGMGLSQNLWQLSASYGIMVGLAKGACGLVIISLLVAKHYDAKNRGLAVSVIQTASPLSPLFFSPPIYFLVTKFDWRAAALATGVLLLTVALPLAWLGARDPDDVLTSRRSRAGWGSCLPYLRNRPMLLMFAARFSCGVALFQTVHLVAIALSKGFDAATGAIAVGVFGGAAAASALLFGWLSDHYGRAQVLALTYLVRGLGTLVFVFDMPNEIFFYVVVALAMGPTFGTIAVQNVMFYELVGSRMAGLILGLSFIVHQIGSAGGPMLASIAFDVTGSYDAFMAAMGVILLTSAALIYSTISSDTRLPEPVLSASARRL
jgi:MFS family permease